MWRAFYAAVLRCSVLGVLRTVKPLPVFLPAVTVDEAQLIAFAAHLRQIPGVVPVHVCAVAAVQGSPEAALAVLAPGRPKEKRAYTRRVLPVLATPASPNVAFCVKCRDRRPLTCRRVVQLSNQRQALQGRCTDCGTKTRRLLPSALGGLGK